MDDPMSAREYHLVNRIERLSGDTPYAEFFDFLDELKRRKNAAEYEELAEAVRDFLCARIDDQANEELESEL